MRIFLDDERNPVRGEDDWVIVRSVEALKHAVAKHGPEITQFSLDHDLARKLDGNDAVNFIAGSAFEVPANLPALEKVTVHSANTAASKGMLDKLEGSRRNGGLSKGVMIDYRPARDDLYPLAEYEKGRSLKEITSPTTPAAFAAQQAQFGR